MSNFFKSLLEGQNTSESSQELISVENRLSVLENRFRGLELRLSQLESNGGVASNELTQTSNTNEPIQPSTVSTGRISVDLLSKKFREANLLAGDAGDSIDLTLQFTNHLSKDVRAFTGSIVFKDLFDKDILNVELTDESGVRSGKTSIWKGGINYNQFLENHSRLLSIKESDVIIELILERVIYKDGTREVFSQ